MVAERDWNKQMISMFYRISEVAHTNNGLTGLTKIVGETIYKINAHTKIMGKNVVSTYLY